MTREQYVKITKPFRESRKKALALSFVNKSLTLAVFVTYPVLLLLMCWKKDPKLLQTVMIPLAGFILVSLFRYLVNRKRPYETFAMPPVFPKDTKGKSFPSRHVFSAMIIALTVTASGTFAWIGMLMIPAALLLGLVRVFSGVHYPSDVLAGILSALLTWGIGLLFL